MMKKMKNAISLFLILGGILLIFASCGNAETPPTESTPEATTPAADPLTPPVSKEDIEAFTFGYGNDGAALLLDKKQGRFTFNPSRLSSYIGYGSYEEKDGKLLCKTIDERYILSFLRHEEGLRFAGSESTAFSQIPDGSVFRRAKAYTDPEDPQISARPLLPSHRQDAKGVSQAVASELKYDFFDFRNREFGKYGETYHGTLDDICVLIYYGNFDGCEVVCMGDKVAYNQAERTIDVAGYNIRIGSYLPVYVYKDHSFYLIKEAYDMGLLTKQSVYTLDCMLDHSFLDKYSTPNS